MIILNRKNKQINLFGEKVYIHERDSYDVMLMVNFSFQRKLNITPDIFLFQCAKVIEAGSKYSHKYLSWYRILKKIKLRYKLRAKYILKHLSKNELINTCNEIYKLEGLEVPDFEELKKKANPESTLNHQSN